MDELIRKLGGDLGEYTSIPFWSWNNELDEAELIRQIHEFKEQSIDGFIMHARTGLKTEYLGEKWFKCIEACLVEARRLKMQAWVYDENGWPSGFVGGELLKKKENLVQYLAYEKRDSFDPAADAVYALGGGRARRVFAGEAAPEGFHCLYIKDHDSFADILNPAVVTQFIEATHEEYYRRFAPYFGKELAGFFTDEPQYFRYNTPFSRVLPAEYQKEYGEDIFDGLVYLFAETDYSAEFRYKFYLLLNRLFTENFYKRIYDWCEAHNCKFTGHTVEEARLSGQLWACAGAMPTYEYEHIPGIDWLGRGIDCAISPKQAGSAAQQTGKKQVLTETFGCSGWDTTPRELRWITEFQYVNGVNMMCQHLSSYSLKGQGKSDYPPSWSRHNRWINSSKPFNDYFKRLSYILCNTREDADTLVVHPIHSGYLHYERSRDYESIRPLEQAFQALTETLTERGVQYHYGDEIMLKQSSRAEGDKLILGGCMYTTVIVPDMENIDSSTLELLTKYAAGGGRLCFYGQIPSRVDGRLTGDLGLKPTLAFADVTAPAVIKSKSEWLTAVKRSGADGTFLYVYNGDTARAGAIEPACGYNIIDLDGLTVQSGAGAVSVPPMASVMLRLDAASVGAVERKGKAAAALDITPEFKFAAATENCLTVDFVEISFDGKTYEPPVFIHAVNERLIRQKYNGGLWIRYRFDVRELPPRARILFERPDRILDVTFNGAEVKREGSAFDIFFDEADIGRLIRAGSNEFVLHIDYFQADDVDYILYSPDVMESLKNCVVIDTEIESVYVLGDFGVDSGRALVGRPAPASLSGLQNQGFPNFAGEVTFRAAADLKESYDRLTLSGRYMGAAVKVNGTDCPGGLLSQSIAVGHALKKGRNEIELTLSSSMRNMLGPHHFAPMPEPTALGHYHFNFRGTWQGNKAADFTPEYFTVPFGLDKVVLEN